MQKNTCWVGGCYNAIKDGMLHTFSINTRRKNTPRASMPLDRHTVPLTICPYAGQGSRRGNYPPQQETLQHETARVLP